VTIVRVQVAIPRVSGGASEDTIVNTWGFDMDKDEGTGNAVLSALLSFYTGLAAYLSPMQAWNSGGKAKFYDMTDAEPRVPWKESVFTFTGAFGATTLPTECCIAMSFQGDPISGVEQRRRRGRIYLGPLFSGAVSTTNGLLTPAVTSLVVTQMTALEAASTAAASWTWGVISNTPSLNFVRATSGWVDNAVDIQRRRGYDATLRTVWS
jgi:hypothetical protein